MSNSKKPKSSPIADYLRPVIDAKYRIRSDAAKDLGIDESYLSRICSGKKPGVSEAIIEQICDKLGLDKEEEVLRLFLTNHPGMRKFFSKPNKPIPFSGCCFSRALRSNLKHYLARITLFQCFL